MSDKIQARHLERTAYVYVRQSTLQQVRHNVESQRRQYGLQERARALGFQQVVVIDEDLGVTGTGHRERRGCWRRCAMGRPAGSLPSKPPGWPATTVTGII